MNEIDSEKMKRLLNIREKIRESGDFLTPLAAQTDLPKKDGIECLIMIAALLEACYTDRNKYLPFCRHTDGFSDQIWENSWRLLRTDLPIMYASLLPWI